MTEKKRTFDKNQTAAINATINSVVSAGAGSGKTTVLAERFSNLVIQKGLKVEEILTLTFTKKATVEMSDRIYKVLKKHAPDAAKDFYKANIKTLDSYCASVAKMGAQYYGISPDFTQDAEIETTIQNMALPFILKHRDNLAIKTLVNTSDFSKIAKELFVNPIIKNSTVSEPIDFDSCLEFQKKEVINAWNTESKKILEMIFALQEAEQNFSGKRSSKFILALTDFLHDEQVPEVNSVSTEFNAQTSKEAKELSEYLTKLFSCGSPSRVSGAEEITEIFALLKEKVEVLSSIADFIDNFSVTKELFPLLKEFQESANAVKRQSGKLTFKDIASLALCILKDIPEIRQIEKQKYKAIMIDEFQDNNSQQRDILFMLAEKEERMEKGVPCVEELCPEKLFFVGDEKQSIYLFRGADVSVFRGLSEDFAKGNLNMSTNYRSKPALIASFNTIFGGFPYCSPNETKEKDFSQPSVFYSEQQAISLSKQGLSVPKYEAVYKEVTMPEFAKSETDFSAHIHFALYPKKTEAEKGFYTAEEAEAVWVAKKIKTLVAEQKYKVEDIAILMRNYSLQPLYERILLENGIPYNTETITGFFGDGPVNDLVSFLSLCANPANSFAYEQLLLSPFVNLSVDEANAIIMQENPPFSQESLNVFEEKLQSSPQSSLQTDVVCNSPLESQTSPQTDTTPCESKLRFLRAKEQFESLSKKARVQPITKTITELWYTLGYRYETLWNDTVFLYSKLYDFLYELARQADENNESLSTFTKNLAAYKNDSEKLQDMDIPLEQKSGVHILTIHKSKGLEYPVVFIVGTHKGSRRETNQEATYASREFGITVNVPGTSNYFYNKIHELNKQMESAELRRLVYVALTRAKDELYITNGNYESTKDATAKFIPGGSSCPNTIFNVLEPVFLYYEDSMENQNIQSPFTVEYISPYPRNAENSKTKNTESQKIQIAKTIEKSELYKNAKILQTEKIQKPYILPSSHEEYFFAAESESFSQTSPQGIGTGTSLLESKEEEQDELFDEISKIIESTIPKSQKSPQESLESQALSVESPESQESSQNSEVPPTESPTSPQSSEVWCSHKVLQSAFIPFISTQSVGGTACSHEVMYPPRESQVHNSPLESEDENTEAEPKFGYNHFGSMAHAYLEAAVKNEEVVIPKKITAGLEDSKEKLQTLDKICKKMAELFLNSELGKSVKNAKWQKTEYPFKLKTENGIVKGIIDLVFKDSENNFTVVDYKTDRTIVPERYKIQLLWYKKAISEMFSVPESSVKSYIYYLRYGKMHEV